MQIWKSAFSPWMYARLKCVALVFLLDMGAMLILSFLAKLGVQVDFFQEFLEVIWGLAMVQIGNLVIVFEFSPGIVKRVVTVAWFLVQVIGVLVASLFMVGAFDEKQSEFDSHYSQILVLAFLVVSQFAYWYGTAKFLRMPEDDKT